MSGQTRVDTSFDNNPNRSSIALVTGDSRNIQSLQTDSELVRPSQTEESKISSSDPELPVYESRAAYEEALIENRELRLRNIEEHLNEFIRVFLAHFLATLILLMQLTIFPQLKVQVAVVILMGLSAYSFCKDVHNLLSPSYRKRFRWKKMTLMLSILEGSLMLVTWFLLLGFLFDKERFGGNVPIIIWCNFLASFLYCFCIKSVETPCTATNQLAYKIVILLRFMLGMSVLLKVSERTEWDWCATFWPFWCSFAILGIVVVTSIIVLLNNWLLYWNEETSFQNFLASFWAFMVCCGFVASTLASLIKIIQIFDFKEELSQDQEMEEKRSMNPSYDPKMVPLIILQFPLCYTFTICMTTLVFKQYIINWFEYQLYVSKEDERRRAGANDEEAGQSEEEEEEEENQPVHIFTYIFSRPQFIKRLTNTYFKKSMKEEKARIIARDMFKQFKETAKGKHKKTKSDSNFNAHFRDFSSFDNSFQKHKAKKPSKFKQNEKFLEFPQEEEEGDQEVKHMQKGRMKEKDAKRFMSQDFKFDEYDTGRHQSQRFESVANRMSISLTQKECCICFDDKPDAVIMECGHGGICYECAKTLIFVEPRVCHLCREPIFYVLKMDLGCVYSNFFKVISATFVDEYFHDEEPKNEQEQSQEQPIEQRQSNSPSREQEQADQADPTLHIYFLQNPFLMGGAGGPQEEEASGNDVIAFVSPRPDEGEGNDGQIQEELKEDERKVGGYYKFQDEKCSSEGYFDSQRSQSLAKQVHNKFNLLQLKMGNDPNQFYKLENVSNADSLIISARSSRLDSTLRRIPQHPTSPDHRPPSIRQSDISQRDPKEQSQRIKFQNNRGQSKVLVEEFFASSKVINMEKVGSMIVKQDFHLPPQHFD